MTGTIFEEFSIRSPGDVGFRITRFDFVLFAGRTKTLPMMVPSCMESKTKPVKRCRAVPDRGRVFFLIFQLVVLFAEYSFEMTDID